MTALEDDIEDILSKAIRGSGRDPADVARRAGIDPGQLQRVLDGDFDEDAARRAAAALELDPDRVAAIGRREYAPAASPPPELESITTAYGSMDVNAYLVRDPKSTAAAVFDTGADADPILQLIRSRDLDVGGIFITHSHPDHIAGLKSLRRALASQPPLRCSRTEPVSDADPIDDGDTFEIGSLRIEARLTAGHSPGGLTFVVTGLSVPLAMVGDALFAGSIGGANISYRDALDHIRRKIFTLPEETIICPGHGPLTTVGQEKQSNPFFP